MELLNILVVDDRIENLENARKQFAGNNVKLICCTSFFPIQEIIDTIPFDMVITDLMLPGEPYGIDSKNASIGKDVPYGLVIAIMAKNAGIPHVSIVSNINHHSGPIAWAMDRLIGNHHCISFYQDDVPKDYLTIAEKHLRIIIIQSSTIHRKKMLIAGFGCSNDYLRVIGEHFKEDYTYAILDSSKGKNHVFKNFLKSQCDVCILVGEILVDSAHASKLGDLFIGDIVKKIVATKSREQKLIVCGFVEKQNSDEENGYEYQTLPIRLSDLKI